MPVDSKARARALSDAHEAALAYRWAAVARRDAVIRARAAGNSIRKITEATGVAPTTVMTWTRKDHDSEEGYD